MNRTISGAAPAIIAVKGRSQRTDLKAFIPISFACSVFPVLTRRLRVESNGEEMDPEYRVGGMDRFIAAP